MKKEIDNKMNDLVMFRGTKEEIFIKINSINSKTEVSMTKDLKHLIKDNDFYFDVCLGMDQDKYLDYEIFVLPTNKKDNFIVTEVTVL